MFRRLSRLSAWSFVITLIWIGFLLAISLLETPVRSRTPDVTLADKLAIGHRVFHTLNRVEWLFLIGLATLAVPRSPGVTRNIRWLLAAVLAVLVVQTVLLFTILDHRTLAIIRGESVPPAAWHLIYIVLEVVKVLMLCGLATMQLRRFAIATAELRREL